MSEPTYVPEPVAPLTTDQKIDRLLAIVATRDDLAEIKHDMATMKKTLDQHTTALDTIAKNTADWNAEMEIMRSRLKRHEDALKLVAEKLNLDLTNVLH